MGQYTDLKRYSIAIKCDSEWHAGVVIEAFQAMLKWDNAQKELRIDEWWVVVPFGDMYAAWTAFVDMEKRYRVVTLNSIVVEPND